MNKASRARRSAKYTTSMPSPALALAVPIPAAELSASRSASILARQRGALVSWVTSPWSPTLTGLGIAAIALALFLNTLLRPGWVTFGAIDENVARGEWILAHHAVQRVDPFSWWMGSKPWQNSEWLADVLFALAYRAFGWAGIVLLNSLATLALGLVVGLASARRVGGLPLLIATAFVVGASNFFTVFTLAHPGATAPCGLGRWTSHCPGSKPPPARVASSDRYGLGEHSSIICLRAPPDWAFCFRGCDSRPERHEDCCCTVDGWCSSWQRWPPR